LWGFAPNGQSAVGSGVYFQGTYALGGTVSPTTGTAGSSDGDYLGGRLGYANGPVNVALSLAQEKNLLNGDFDYANIGGSYNFGPATLDLLYGQNKNGSAGGNLKYKTYEIGATINAGPGYIPISFSDGKLNDAIGSHAQQFAVGYVYNLSKRTSLYATYSHIDNKTGALATFAGGNGSSSGLAPANGTGNGYDIGVKTSF
jgi:predicted porin